MKHKYRYTFFQLVSIALGLDVSDDTDEA